MSAIESFATTQLQNVIPSYLYQEYADDDDLQAFVDAQNALAQGYHDWFLRTPLALYTSPSINGPLLDWTGQGIYGISRPVLSTQASQRIAGYNEYPYNTFPYDGLKSSITGTAQIASDDIYKRVLTWHLYKGDGYQFSLLWLKKRIARFLNGANGMDFPVLDALPSITVSGSTFTVNEAYSQSLVFLEQCISNNVLALPFQYTVVINALTLVNNGGVLVVVPFMGYPSNSAGLPAGAIYSDGGVVSVVPGITPNPAAPPVFFGSINSDELLALGGGNLPFSLTPITATNQLFGTGNGSTSTFQLSIGGLPVQSGITVTSIFRNDWQGNQLLYATARTNAVINSGSAATWSTSGSPTITANAAAAPDGTTTAALVAGTGSATGQGVFRTSTRTAAISDVITASYYVKFSSGMSQYRIRLEGAAFPTTVFGIFDVSAGSLISTGGGANLVGTSITSIGGGYYRLTVTGIAQTAGAVNFSCDNAIASAWASNIWGSQVEWSSVPTSYIATTSAAVTVTDYSVGSTGLIPLGQVPITGAQLTWNGSGIQSGTGQLWNNGGVVCIA